MRVFAKPTDIQVKAGESFGIALEVLGAGGYQWAPEPGPALLDFVGSDFRQPQPQSRICGTSEQVLKFRPTGKGVVHLRLVCKRPWDAVPSEIKSVAIQIE